VGEFNEFHGDGPQLKFVFILTDDQRFDTLWAMPYVQRDLVTGGVLFENAIGTFPLCCPTRASILAGGFYAKNTGVLTNGLPLGGFPRFKDTNTLATRLRRAGYRTALVGKYLNDYPLGYVPPGWSLFIGQKGPGGLDQNFDYNWNAFRVTVGSSAESSTTGEVAPVAEYVTDYQRDVVLDFISELSNEPFFVLWSTYAPHSPATPAVEDEGKFTDYLYRERAWGELDVSDKPVGYRLKHRQELQRREEGSVDEERPRRQLRSLQAVDRGVKAIIETLAAVGKLEV
jgi:arylsulfatase A-like enzyme